MWSEIPIVKDADYRMAALRCHLCPVCVEIRFTEECFLDITSIAVGAATC